MKDPLSYLPGVAVVLVKIKAIAFENWQNYSTLWLLKLSYWPLANVATSVCRVIILVLKIRAPLKMHFFRGNGVSSVLKSSFAPCKLRFSAWCFLVTTKKLLFLKVPIIKRPGYYIISVTILSLLFSSEPVLSQKGTGAVDGVAQQDLALPVVTISGEIVEIQTGPCEKSIGKSPVGTHILVKTDTGNMNIHLGPAMAVHHVVTQLTMGKRLSLDVFRTERLPKNAYIAKLIVVDDSTIQLRDDNLRPIWAHERKVRHGKNASRALGRPWPCWSDNVMEN